MHCALVWTAYGICTHTSCACPPHFALRIVCECACARNESGRQTQHHWRENSAAWRPLTQLCCWCIWRNVAGMLNRESHLKICSGHDADVATNVEFPLINLQRRRFLSYVCVRNRTTTFNFSLLNLRNMMKLIREAGQLGRYNDTFRDFY